MHTRIYLWCILFVLLSCNEPQIEKPQEDSKNDEWIAAVDISSYPEIAETNPVFYDENGAPKDFLEILRENAVNTIRLRLWVNPLNNHGGLAEQSKFAETLKAKGFKIWLSLHYSDTWADPAHQVTPAAWQNLDISALSDSVYEYTKKVTAYIQPEYIQIGNEINTGFLHPYGHIENNYEQFLLLMQAGIKAVRESSESTQIMIHFAGTEGSEWFYNRIATLDYDIIGLSYYPIWHGKSLENLSATMNQLSQIHQKKIIIAETAYPFTLDWNDRTNNIVGLTDQLILPDFQATPLGQTNFLEALKNLSKNIALGYGLCYWGAELIAWKGNKATDGSAWENQALFDFKNQVLPAIKELSFVKGN